MEVGVNQVLIQLQQGEIKMKQKSANTPHW